MAMVGRRNNFSALEEVVCSRHIPFDSPACGGYAGAAATTSAATVTTSDAAATTGFAPGMLRR